MSNLECSDCGQTRKRTRVVNGDVLCGSCEGDRKETIFALCWEPENAFPEPMDNRLDHEAHPDPMDE